MLSSKVRTDPDLTRRDVQWGRGGAFKHAMLGKAVPDVLTSNDGGLSNPGQYRDTHCVWYHSG